MKIVNWKPARPAGGLKIVLLALSILIFLPKAASAALIVQAPKYIGLNSGLVGYWSFDGKDMAGVTAYDRSGNANNGTLTNGPTRAIGKLGQALSFDGVNDYFGGTSASAAPTLISVQSSDYSDSANTETTASISWVTGDIVVVLGSTESNALSGCCYLNTPTATGLSFSLVTSVNTGGDNDDTVNYLWSATAGSSGSSAVSADRGDLTTTGKRGITAFVYRGSNGLGNTNTLDNSTAKVISLIRGSNNSAVVVGMADWNAVNDTVVTSSPAGGTQQVAQFVTGAWTAFDFYWGGQGTAGTTDYGITDHTGTVDMSGIVAEVLGSTSGANLNVGNVNTVSFWVKPNSTTQSIIDMDGTKNIDILSGTVRANSFTSPTIYIDGIQSSTFPDSGWHQVTVTTNTAVNANTFFIGKISTSYFNGLIDDVRVYNRALNENEIKRLYRIGATLKVNTSINNDSLVKGLVGYWSLNAPDIAGTTVYDRSGNAKNGSALGQDISRSGLVGWWKLDGASSGSIANNTTVGFEDFSGSANNGTASNANGTGMAWTTPKIGVGAVSFDATDDFVTTADTTEGASTISISLWLYRNTDVNYHGIINHTNGLSGTDGWWLSLNDSGILGALNFSHADIDHLTAAGIITKQVWTHVVVVFDDAANTVKFYTNGSLASNLTDNDAITESASNLRIGLEGSFYGNQYFDGKIDDVRIYNRALTGGEISQLYAYGLPKFSPAIGKIGQGIDSTLSYVNPGNVSSSVNSFAFWLKTASSSPTVNLLDLNAGQYINIVAGTVKANGLTSPSIFVDGVSGSTVNAGWHHIAVTTGTAVNASAVNLGLNATTTAPLDGAIDDVRFYNRVINNDEIKRLYRIGATLKINTSINNDSLAKGLVGYWSFDGKDMAGVTAYDRSGNSNNGTLTGGPTRAIGKLGQALSFDGVDDGIDLLSNTSLNRTTALTISAWIKPNNVTSCQRILEHGASDGAQALEYNLNISCNTSLKASAEIWTNSGGYQVVDSTPSYTAGVWAHEVFTWDGTTMIMYKDGVVGGTALRSGTIIDINDVTSIGYRNVATDVYFFNGLIDDVRVYNRALTSAEIQRLYNLGR